MRLTYLDIKPIKRTIVFSSKYKMKVPDRKESKWNRLRNENVFLATFVYVSFFKSLWLDKIYYYQIYIKYAVRLAKLFSTSIIILLNYVSMRSYDWYKSTIIILYILVYVREGLKSPTSSWHSSLFLDRYGCNPEYGQTNKEKLFSVVPFVEPRVMICRTFSAGS